MGKIIKIIDLLRAGISSLVNIKAIKEDFWIPRYKYRLFLNGDEVAQKFRFERDRYKRDLSLLAASHRSLFRWPILNTGLLLLRILLLQIRLHIRGICSCIPRQLFAHVFPLYGRIFYYTKNRGGSNEEDF
jgi:hypothetical protein